MRTSFVLVSILAISAVVVGQEPVDQTNSSDQLPPSEVETSGDDSSRRMPTPRFFYYDSDGIEWIVSAEANRLKNHLLANPESAALFESLGSSVDETADLDGVRAQMAHWIERERSRFDQSGSNPVRTRKAEGIVAYMRTHDFDLGDLTKALLERTGATDVELVAVHLVNDGESSYKLKVVLPDDQIGIGKQGFNIVLAEPTVTYTGAVYSLAAALYDVHEIINAEATGTSPDDIATETLPPPDAFPSSSETQRSVPLRTQTVLPIPDRIDPTQP